MGWRDSAPTAECGLEHITASPLEVNVLICQMKALDVPVSYIMCFLEPGQVVRDVSEGGGKERGKQEHKELLFGVPPPHLL